jgi:hypothetical protein
VVGHGEYRRVTNLEPQFRRCFAEVFRQRSFLFLGSSLSEEYFLNLFGEILEIYGPNPWPHFAFVEQGKTDAWFLLERMNISVCEYRTHGELPDMLIKLGESIIGTRCRPTSWSFALSEPEETGPAWSRGARLTIRRSRLPTSLRGDSGGRECVAVSVGRSGLRAHFSPGITRYLKDVIPHFSDLKPYVALPRDCYTVRVGQTACYAVAARDPQGDGDVRDLRAIRRSMKELLNKVQQDGFDTVHLQLLSVGPTSRQTIPPLYSFTEIVRAFGAWSRQAPDPDLHLNVYIMDPTVLSSLSAGAVDVHELLSCSLIRFWVEIDSGERASSRVTLYRDGETHINEIMTFLGLPTSGRWSITVHPPPRKDSPEIQQGDPAKLSLAEVGVVPGSTLRFSDPRHGSAVVSADTAGP